MSEYRSCRNHCIFCFVNQMPKGMRDTLYFHDDDARLSFLQGNYITMTNMSDHDIDRIILYHLEPINISFHTMNPELRRKMLHNRFAGDIMPKVMRLKNAGIRLNGQIVLCKGWNDGEDLEHSLKTFEQLLPELESVSVVPVGMTKFREETTRFSLNRSRKRMQRPFLTRSKDGRIITFRSMARILSMPAMSGTSLRISRFPRRKTTMGTSSLKMESGWSGF